MTGLLVRMEFFPGSSDLLPVPVDHLFKLMFLHERPSDLVLFQDQERIGNLHLQPHRFPPGTNAARNLLAVTGAMTLRLPGLDTHYLTLRGAVELDDRDAARHFELTATVHEPVQNTPRHPVAGAQKSGSSLVIVLDGEPVHGHYHYAVRQDTAVLAEQSGTAAELLDQPELRGIGLSPAVIGGLVAQQAASTETTARRGVLHGKGEDLETYDVTVRQADSVVATVQLSQLGQIMAVKTAAGYSLLDESVAAGGDNTP